MPITVHLHGRKDPLVCDSGICVREVVPARDSRGYPVVAALVNNDVASLQTRLAMNCTARFRLLRKTGGWFSAVRFAFCFRLPQSVPCRIAICVSAIRSDAAFTRHCAMRKTPPTAP